MRRKEAGLAFWLKGTKADPKLTQNPTKNGKPLTKFRPWNFKSELMECPLEFHSGSINVRLDFSDPVPVKDGFIYISSDEDRSNRDITESLNSPEGVCQVNLLRTAKIRSIRLPEGENTRIQQSLLAITPYCRRLQMNIGQISIRNLKTVQFSTPAMGKADNLINDKPDIYTLTFRVSIMPMRQPSIDLKTLSEDEFREYMSEAANNKGISADTCELLALFKHVPIEMISKLRFLDLTKELVYTISDGLNRTQTRVYDLMVIQDESKNEIHLIPHRTRNRMVYLN